MCKKVMVAMSGGVDSSVAAVLLRQQGYAVCGATLKLFENDEIGVSNKKTCCSLEDVEAARNVADKLGFDHFVFHFGPQFKQNVIERFVAGYINGETPNPCIDCNRYIKFGRLLERALLLEQDCIATGHYANVQYDQNSGRYLLKKAKDSSKDQTYVLYCLTQEELSRTIFPLGGLLKSEVRAFAEEHGLINANKPDSQDICFVKDGDYVGFLKNVMGVSAEAGNFEDAEQTILGRHKGLIAYTIGQRKGLGLSASAPLYVIGKDKKRNAVTLGSHEDLFSDHLTAREVNLIAIDRLAGPMQVAVKTRYSQKEAKATLFPVDEDKIYVEFKEKQRAITPGQAVVFYQDDIVIGGGTIES